MGVRGKWAGWLAASGLVACGASPLPDGVARVEITTTADPLAHWVSSGYTRLTPPVHLPSSSADDVHRCAPCGREHPLFGVQRITMDELRGHAFVAPPVGEDRVSPEGWPVELERIVGCRVTSLWVGIELCRRSSFLAVFPDAVIRGAIEPGALHRLPFEALPPVGFYAAHRHPLGGGGRTEAVMAAVEHTMTAGA